MISMSDMWVFFVLAYNFHFLKKIGLVVTFFKQFVKMGIISKLLTPHRLHIMFPTLSQHPTSRECAWNGDCDPYEIGVLYEMIVTAALNKFDALMRRLDQSYAFFLHLIFQLLAMTTGQDHKLNLSFLPSDIIRKIIKIGYECVDDLRLVRIKKKNYR